MISSIIWISLSYILAFTGKVDIAEELSKTIVTGIICIILPYFLKSLFETKWEKEMEYKRDISFGNNQQIEVEDLDDELPSG